jgi:hypothetical protein
MGKASVEKKDKARDCRKEKREEETKTNAAKRWCEEDQGGRSDYRAFGLAGSDSGV